MHVDDAMMLVGKLALIAEAEAAIQGMTADNKQREACGHAMAYDGNCFFGEAKTMERVAESLLTPDVIKALKGAE